MTYVVGDPPVLPGADVPYLQLELRKIAASLREIEAYGPRPAATEPEKKRDGMVRLARAPWRPLGGTVDRWVYYDGTDLAWKAL